MAPEASCCWKVIRCWLFIPSPRAAVGRDGEFHVSEMSRGGGELTESPTPALSPPRSARVGGRGTARQAWQEFITRKSCSQSFRFVNSFA